MSGEVCAGCPFPDQVAALELVRLREGIGRLAEEYGIRRDGLRRRASDGNREADWMDRREANTWDVAAEELRALLDDNQGDSC